jgi:uncharacterized delta-60 repeat protein
MGLRSIWTTSSGQSRPRHRGCRGDHVRRPVEALERRTLLSTTLPAVADADVQNLASDPNTLNANFGADELLRVRRIDGETLETFVTFDLRQVEAVVRAELKMTGGQVGTPGEAVLVGAFPADGPFVEGNGTHGGGLDTDNNPSGEIRFNNRPGSSGGSMFTSIVTTRGDYFWNVTDYVAAEKAAGKEFVSIGLRFTSGGTNLVTFGSREGSGGDAPALVVEEDGGGPNAAFFAPDITGPTPDQQVVVTYSDGDGIDPATIDVNDITVRAPGGPALEVRGVTVQQADANSIIATYTVTGPGGAWDAADNQAYTTRLGDGAVRDLNGNPATGGPDVFTVSIDDDDPPPGGGDTQAPGAAFTKLPPTLRTAGGTSSVVEVTFTDNVGVLTSGLDAADLAVTGPGGTPLTVEGVTLAPAGGGATSVVATFTVAAPGGSWDVADNGSYQVRLAAGAAADAAGNASAELTNTFEVAVGTGEPPPDPVPGDTTGPVATVVPLQPIVEAGGATQQVRVTYVDDSAVSLASIDLADIVVAGGPAGSPPLTVTDVSVSPPAGGKSVTATYTLTAPGGSWDTADNGTYAVTVAAGAAADTSGNPSTPAVTVNLEVNIPAPEPAVDPTFGGGGAVNTGFVAEAAAGQPDGKLVVVGRQGDLAAGTSQLVVQRRNPDGSLDPTFGTNGTVVGAQGANEAAFAVAVTQDGSIVVAGRRDGDMMVTRFRPTGALDTKFGTGGIAVADFDGEDTAYSIAIAADGSIVAAGGSLQPAGGAGGAAATDTFAFARFLKDGRPDPFFGRSGLSFFAQGTGGNVAGAVAIDESGRIVAAGPGEGGKVAVVRLSANGTEDTSFGANGILVVDQLATLSGLGRPDRSIGVVAQPRGAVLVSNRSPGGDFGIARVRTDGTLDPAFGGGDGVTTVDFGGDDDADQLLVQGSGEIFALGTTTAGGNQLAVAAVAPDGSLITSFGEGGKLTVEATPTVAGRELRIGDLVLRAFGSLQGGRLVLGGSDQRPAAVTSSPLRRLNTPGATLLGTFGGASSTNRKGSKLSFMDADGTVVTMSLKGPGTGQAFATGSTVDVVLSGTADGALVVTAKGGGDGRFAVRNVQSDGGLKTVTGKTMDVGGTFAVNGAIGKASLGRLTGTLAASGPITALLFSGDVTGRVLSGANFGVNGQPGGTGSAADGFGQGRIGKLTVAGQMVGATVAAGVDPVDGQMLDNDDKLVGGTASAIGPVTVKRGADASTRFVAGAFAPKVKLPKPVNPLEDARFTLLQ